MILDGRDGGQPATLAGLALCLAAGLSYAAYAQVNQRIVQTPGTPPRRRHRRHLRVRRAGGVAAARRPGRPA
jgi:drug/metabolite transporter (DMT)-like permease